jgi:cyanophycinase
MTGTLALVGGAEFTVACEEVDRALLQAAPSREVLVLPTGAAFEHPERVARRAKVWFESLGAAARDLHVLGRPEALTADHVQAVRDSPFTYLAGGSPMHLRSVLKDTDLWAALVEAYADGAVVAGSSAGAMVLTDPMVDPRGGAFTVGLGLQSRLAVVPEAEQWHHDRMRRTRELAAGFALVTLDSGSALVKTSDGTWTTYGNVQVFQDGHAADLSALPS